MINFRQKGSTSRTETYLKKMQNNPFDSILDKYGRAGVQALSSATPVDTGLAAQSWDYEIEKTSNSARIVFYNSDVENGFPVAIMLQYGHGTRNGGWVEGIDYINPAIQPVFEKFVDELWREVNR